MVTCRCDTHSDTKACKACTAPNAYPLGPLPTLSNHGNWNSVKSSVFETNADGFSLHSME